MDSPYIAMIMPFAGNFEIRGWAFCDGRLLSIAQYSAVFALVGTTYGGDGQQTFGLPDLRGRAPIGFGNANYGVGYALGQQGGSPTVTLLPGNVPPHTHPATAIVSVEVGASSPNTDDPAGGYLTTQSNSFYATVGSPGSFLGGVTGTVDVRPNASANAPVSTMAPYLAVNYLFALEGIFPSRN